MSPGPSMFQRLTILTMDNSTNALSEKKKPVNGRAGLRILDFLYTYFNPIYHPSIYQFCTKKKKNQIRLVIDCRNMDDPQNGHIKHK